MDKLPNFIAELDPQKKADITQEERDQLMRFNTDAYWWCYYDKATDKLYNQFCCLILENGYDYLLGLGHIDKDKNFLKELS